jgi:hypothetical protein
MSNIISATIDENYPIAGQDNDSQGFRDNFSIIKAGLTTANAEVSALQNNSARTNSNNNFQGNEISNVRLRNTGQTIFQGGSLSAGVEVNFQNGHYQRFTAQGVDITLTLRNFPVNSVGRMILELYGDGTTRTITFAAPSGALKLDQSVEWVGTPRNSVEVTNQFDPVIVEFWSYNGGITVFGRYLGSYTA